MRRNTINIVRQVTLLLCLALALPASGQKNRKAATKKRGAATETKTVSPADIDRMLSAYQFQEALNSCQKELAKKNKTQTDVEVLEAQQRRAQLGASMLRGTERVVFIDSVRVAKDAFFKAFPLSKGNGFVDAPKNLLPSLGDRRCGQAAFMNELKDHLVVALPSDSSDRLRLASMERIGSEWSSPTSLSIPSADDAEHDFPFFQADGLTLYFAQTGEESLGGYDVFVTRRNSETGEYLRPENMGMPFNSPDNDYMIVIDERSSVGWLATDRRQAADSICIYCFIPNEVRDVYTMSSANEAEVVRAAQILSIAESQQGAKERIATALNLMRVCAAEDAQTVEGPQPTFVISDDVVYHSVKDFRSDKAAQLAQQSVSLQEELTKTQQTLDALRQEYHKTKLSTTAADILSLEQQAKEQAAQLSSVLKQMRSEEAKSL